jgi:pantothenate kinase
MDGFHFYKSHLSRMSDPDLAFSRRGAEWTFDSEKFLCALVAAREKGQGLFPSFDHSVGDPVEDDIELSRDHEFVIIEGLYLLLPAPNWSLIKGIVDLSIYIDCDEECIKQRLIERHMRCFHMNAVDAEYRVLNNDLPNAVDIALSKSRADLIYTNGG